MTPLGPYQAPLSMGFSKEEWVAIPFSRVFPQLRDLTQVSSIAGRFFTAWAPGKPIYGNIHVNMFWSRNFKDRYTYYYVSALREEIVSYFYSLIHFTLSHHIYIYIYIYISYILKGFSDKNWYITPKLIQRQKL